MAMPTGYKKGKHQQRSRRASAVAGRTIHRWSATSRMLSVTVVNRKVTSSRCVHNLEKCQVQILNQENLFRAKSSAKHVDSQVNSDIDNSDCVDDDQEKSYGLYNVNARKSKGNSPYLVTVSVNNCDVTMEVDTGASRSTISEEVYRKKLSNCSLHDCSVSLTSYSRQKIPLLGCVKVTIQYQNETDVCE